MFCYIYRLHPLILSPPYQLLNQKLPGIYYILSAMSILSMSSLTWFLFIRQGAYQESIENIEIVI